MTDLILVESVELELHDTEVGYRFWCIEKEQEMLENVVGTKNLIEYVIKMKMRVHLKEGCIESTLIRNDVFIAFALTLSVCDVVSSRR